MFTRMIEEDLSDMDIESKLKSWNKKTITKSELEGLLGIHSDEKLSPIISDAQRSGLLSPVKSSGTNGNRTYPIFLKYRLSMTTDNSDSLREIALLHPAITNSGYLQKRPDIFREHSAALHRLSTYLFRTNPSIRVSRKERSFEVFGEEKLLDDSSFKRLLDALGLTADKLYYYDTPEYCFNDYIPARKDDLTLLICENKDIWFNIRRRMYEDGAREIFGVPIDGVVYGCGNKVSQLGALEAYTGFLGAQEVQYLYWGDIDRAGLNIYVSLLRNNPNASLKLFKEAYVEMLRLAEGREMPKSEDHRERMEDYQEMLSRFPEQDRERLLEYIARNERVPQEIITYEGLLKYMR